MAELFAFKRVVSVAAAGAAVAAFVGVAAAPVASAAVRPAKAVSAHAASARPALPPGQRFVGAAGLRNAMGHPAGLGGQPAQRAMAAVRGLPAVPSPSAAIREAQRDPAAARALARLESNEAAPKALTPTSGPFTYQYLEGVSCWSTTGCEAVGLVDEYGTDEMTAFKWNGTKWSTQSVEQYSVGGKVQDAALYGVSCTSATNCIAVGVDITDTSAAAERWNGTTWSLIPAAMPSSDGGLSSVSCAGTSFCQAVGSYWNGGEYVPVADIWNGSSWTSETLPTAVTHAQLFGVSCPTSSFCVAVGETGDYSLGLDFNSGGTPKWSEFTTTNPGSDDDPLESVSCPAGSVTCFAAGYQETSSVEIGLIETFTNSGGVSSVSATSAGVNPGLTFGYLDGISCTSATTCTAVGIDSSTGDGLGSTFAEQLRSGKWTAVSSASPGSVAYDEFAGVSCATSSSCAAVGDSYAASTAWVDVSLAETLSSGHFVSDALPLSHDTWGEVGGIACEGTTFCLAVGEFDNGDVYRPLAEAWNGSHWTEVAVPSSAAESESWLWGVSCHTAAFCMLVGGQGIQYETETGYAVAFNGTSLTMDAPPVTALTTYSYFEGVSCLSTTSCVLVGDGEYGPIAAVWNGHSFAVDSLPAVLDDYWSPEAIDCTSSTNCSALVQFSQDDDYQTSIEHYNGKTWTVAVKKVSVPLSSEVELSSISCFSASRCVAAGVGWISGAWWAVSSIWNGHTWTTVVPSFGSYADDAFGAVTCVSATSCLAVGWASAGAGVDFAADATLTGSKWSSVSAAGSKSAGADLYGVACVGTGLSKCFATGSSEFNESSERPMVSQKTNSTWKVVVG